MLRVNRQCLQAKRRSKRAWKCTEEKHIIYTEEKNEYTGIVGVQLRSVYGNLSYYHG